MPNTMRTAQAAEVANRAARMAAAAASDASAAAGHSQSTPKDSSTCSSSSSEPGDTTAFRFTARIDSHLLETALAANAYLYRQRPDLERNYFQKVRAELVSHGEIPDNRPSLDELRHRFWDLIDAYRATGTLHGVTPGDAAGRNCVQFASRVAELVSQMEGRHEPATRMNRGNARKARRRGAQPATSHGSGRRGRTSPFQPTRHSFTSSPQEDPAQYISVPRQSTATASPAIAPPSLPVAKRGSGKTTTPSKPPALPAAPSKPSPATSSATPSKPPALPAAPSQPSPATSSALNRKASPSQASQRARQYTVQPRVAPIATQPMTRARKLRIRGSPPSRTPETSSLSKDPLTYVPETQSRGEDEGAHGQPIRKKPRVTHTADVQACDPELVPDTNLEAPAQRATPGANRTPKDAPEKSLPSRDAPSVVKDLPVPTSSALATRGPSRVEDPRGPDDRASGKDGSAQDSIPEGLTKVGRVSGNMISAKEKSGAASETLSVHNRQASEVPSSSARNAAEPSQHVSGGKRVTDATPPQSLPACSSAEPPPAVSGAACKGKTSSPTQAQEPVTNAQSNAKGSCEQDTAARLQQNRPSASPQKQGEPKAMNAKTCLAATERDAAGKEHPVLQSPRGQAADTRLRGGNPRRSARKSRHVKEDRALRLDEERLEFERHKMKMEARRIDLDTKRLELDAQRLQIAKRQLQVAERQFSLAERQFELANRQFELANGAFTAAERRFHPEADEQNA